MTNKDDAERLDKVLDLMHKQAQGWVKGYRLKERKEARQQRIINRVVFGILVLAAVLLFLYFAHQPNAYNPGAFPPGSAPGNDPGYWAIPGCCG